MTLEQRFAEGDRHALREIHDIFAGRMFGMALRVLADRGLAADAVQQALLQAWRAAHTYDPTRPLEPWLFSITRRAAIDVYRRNKERDQQVSFDLIGNDLHPKVEPPGIEQAWMVWQVRSAVEQLSESDQAIIRMVFFEDLTHREAAERLGLPIGTVKSRLFRAQRKLMDGLAHVNNGAADTGATVVTAVRFDGR